MNEKGFAATSILYTILVLFILIMFSMLSLLNSRNNILNRIQDEIKENLSNLVLKKVSSTINTIQIEYVKNNSDDVVTEITCKGGTSHSNYTSFSSGSEASCTLQNLTPNTQYFYEVCLVYDSGVSDCQNGQTRTSVDVFNSTIRNDTLIGSVYQAGFNKGISNQSEVSISSATNIVDNGTILQFQASYAGVTQYSYSSNAIDVTNLRTLRYKINLNRNCSDYQFSSDLYFGLSSINGKLDNNFDVSSSLHLAKDEVGTGDKYVNIDVSNLSGNKYLKFVLKHGDEFDSCTTYSQLFNIEGIYN